MKPTTHFVTKYLTNSRNNANDNYCLMNACYFSNEYKHKSASLFIANLHSEYEESNTSYIKGQFKTKISTNSRKILLCRRYFVTKWMWTLNANLNCDQFSLFLNSFSFEVQFYNFGISKNLPDFMNRVMRLQIEIICIWVALVELILK